MDKQTLTHQAIISLPIKPKPYKAWDSEFKGFGVAVFPSGSKSYVVRKQVGSKRLLHTLYDIEEQPYKKARKDAEHILDKMARGIFFPETEKRTNNKCTFKAVIRRFREEMPERYASKTGERYDDSIRLEIEMEFEDDELLGSISEERAADFMRRLRHKPSAHNMALKVARNLYSCADEWGWYDGKDPFRKIRKMKEGRSLRFLSDDEKTCVHLAINDRAVDCPIPAMAFRIFMHTGMRNSELRLAQRRHLHGDQINLPDTKTGEASVVLAPEALAILDSIEYRVGDRYLLPGSSPDRPFHSFRNHWQWTRDRATVYLMRDYETKAHAEMVRDLAEDRARRQLNSETEYMIENARYYLDAIEKNRMGASGNAPDSIKAIDESPEMQRAIGSTLPTLDNCRTEAKKRGLTVPVGLTDFRIHDFRHNFASQLAMAGYNEAQIGALLNHRDLASTRRYMHLNTQSRRDSVQNIGHLFAPKKREPR